MPRNVSTGTGCRWFHTIQRATATAANAIAATPLTKPDAAAAPPVYAAGAVEEVFDADVWLAEVWLPVGFDDMPLLAEGFGPLQKPPLQVLYAHCESFEQEAWKLPHAGIRPELVA